MPTPSTSKWPKPKSEDEFEDIVLDALKQRWKAPNASRNGRRGQGQHGVDIYGKPEHLGGKYAGAQCKNTETSTFKMVKDEVEKAKAFTPALSEFYFVVSADRDAQLQREVREYFDKEPESFEVVLLFWDDVTGDISRSDVLVAKWWRGFGHAQNGVAITDLESENPQPEVPIAKPSQHQNQDWRRRRDIESLEVVLSQLPGAVLEAHFDHAYHGIIRDMPLFFWDGFHALVVSASFLLHEDTARKCVTELHDAWLGLVGLDA